MWFKRTATWRQNIVQSDAAPSVGLTGDSPQAGPAAEDEIDYKILPLKHSSL